MAHFAQINSDNVVERIVVVSNDDCAGGDFPSSESIGAAFCSNLFGGEWKQTSYNGNFRKNFAGIGFTYDSQRDAFIRPQPFPSWTLDEATCQWTPPVPHPAGHYTWDEDTLSWISVEL